MLFLRPKFETSPSGPLLKPLNTSPKLRSFILVALACKHWNDSRALWQLYRKEKRERKMKLFWKNMLLFLKRDEVSTINPKLTQCVWPGLLKPQCSWSQGARHRCSVQLAVMLWPRWIFKIVIAIFCEHGLLVLTMSSPAVHCGMMCFMLFRDSKMLVVFRV